MSNAFLKVGLGYILKSRLCIISCLSIFLFLFKGIRSITPAVLLFPMFKWLTQDFSKFAPIKWTDQSLYFLVKWTLSKNAMEDKESNWFSGSIQWSIHPQPLTAQSQCFLTVWRIANFLRSHWWFLNAHQWTKCWSVNAKESETKLPTPWFIQSKGLKSDQTP